MNEERLEHACIFCLRTPSSPVREREKEGGRGKERERGREEEIKRESEKVGERCKIVISIFKRNDGCLGTF